jgi:putative DNA methylase
MSREVTPFALKDEPALIERLLPVQKLSAESFKEQEARQNKTLTALGSYWKGRKPLILNKACIIGCLLPATADPARDLEIFEKLMAMDDESFVVRSGWRPMPREILATLSIAHIADYFSMEPVGVLPTAAPVDWSNPEYAKVQVAWREDLPELERRRLEAQILPKVPYRERVEQVQRPEEVVETVHDHIWDAVNVHLSTNAQSVPELVEQLGIMRFGHRPRVADTFCGSGQIPFEAARLGCDVYAADLNPVACMLTWGAFNIVGGSRESRVELVERQKILFASVRDEIDELAIETDGRGWHVKAFLYCLEVRCPTTGWLVPLLSSRLISGGHRAYVELVPDSKRKRYDILVRYAKADEELVAAAQGTVCSDGRGQEPYLLHTVNGKDVRIKISTLRGDFRQADGSTGNRLRLWDKSDFKPRTDDIYQERLYALLWARPKFKGKGLDHEFRAVTPEDLKRERIVDDIVGTNILDWQAKGWIPDMRIEPGDKTDEPIRTRGWTYWHHLFNPRQLLTGALINRHSAPTEKLAFTQAIAINSRLSRWNALSGVGQTAGTFDNQALNTLFSYGCRGIRFLKATIEQKYKAFPLPSTISLRIKSKAADQTDEPSDIFITDPPYGDAVKYEEILEFFIAWLRKNPPPDFADWVWDSRRSLAIKGEGEDFRRIMVAAYKRMAECMPDNGIQVIMFTHQSGSIWADMANIVWASGLHVTAAWYVVTETDNPLHEGSYVKGTVLLVVRKRSGTDKTTRDDLAWEIQEEVESQVNALTGLNQKAKGLYRDENVFEDADIQMAGYAAALRVLTRYAVIDGRDMTAEAIRPRVKGETTFVDGLIAFAVDTANQCLVPQGVAKAHWNKLSGAERFYLKLLDMEARGVKSLDNYQNFAKAFKVKDFRPLLASQKANDTRLRSAVEFGRAEMGEGSELHQSVLRAVLYALLELVKNVDGSEVLTHLTLNVPDYYSDMTQRALAIDLADYLSKRLDSLRPDEASAARVLSELVKHQRLG